MRNNYLLFVFLVALIGMYSFYYIAHSGIVVKEKKEEGLSISASLFPQYDFARRIAGDKAKVTLILPPGADSHAFEPKAADVAGIHDSDIFIYTGKNMEPWADSLIKGIKESSALIVDASAGVPLICDTGHHGHHCEECEVCSSQQSTESGEQALHEHHHDHDGGDPHFWLDPTLAAKMVANIEEAICSRDPDNADFYRANAKKCTEELMELDREFTEAVKTGKRDTIVFGGAFAYRYFVERYGLKVVTAYSSCSSHAEPSVKAVTDVIKFIKANNIPCIYYEELADPKVARSIAEACEVEALLFSTAHNVTKDELEKGVTFMDIMRGNLENLKKGLE